MKIPINRWFIPNKKNKFHPIALRPVGLMIFAAIIVSIPFVYNVTSAKKAQVLGYASNVTISDLHSLSNQERTSRGLPALNLNSTLNSAAAAKAYDMMTKNYWAHVAPDGTTPWAFIAGSGYQYTVAGENLAKDFSLSSGVVAGWMGSSLHRDNVLGSAYQDVGYAVLNGVLLGSETTLVVAMYATRYTAPAPAPVAAKPSTTPAPQQSAPAAAPETPAPTETPAPATEQAAAEKTNEKSDTKKNDTTTSKTVSSTTTNGVVEGLATSLPVRTYSSFNWGQKVSIVLIGIMILLFVMKHTIIWRQQKRGCQHIWLRAHPLAQATMLTAVTIVTMLSSVGVVL